MPTFVVLLRGVNVGKSKRVPMAEFRSILADLGFSSITTVLNSGNAVFTAPRAEPEYHAAAIMASLRERLGIEVPVIVIAATQLAAVVAECPIAVDPSDHSRFLIAFTQDPATLSGLAPIQALVAPAEQFVIGNQAAYLLCASGILESKAGEALVGKAGKSATTRNWSTVLKLYAIASSAA